MPSSRKHGLLNSWKEIACYLDRGVRTVQRWEKMGLPVRRLGEGSRAPVIAHADDVNRWLLTIEKSRLQGDPRAMHAEFRGDLLGSLRESRVLREQMRALRRDQTELIQELKRTVQALENAVAPSEQQMLMHGRTSAQDVSDQWNYQKTA